METGKIQYSKRCPECKYSFETPDPQAKVPLHKMGDSMMNCPGSGKIGIDLGRRLDPKI